jgi:alpha-amylase
MSTKFFSDGEIHAYFNPYESPYDAYINYMNVLSDFNIRLNAMVPESSADQEIVNLTRIIDEKDEMIRKYEDELKRLKSSKTKINSVKGTRTKAKKTVVSANRKKPSSTKPDGAKKITGKPVKKTPGTRKKKQ